VKRVEECAEGYSDVLVRDRLEESVLLSVSGPNVSDSLVAALGPTIPKSIPLNEGHEILLGGYRALVANYSETGEAGYLIICSPEVGEHIWQQLLSVGTEPIGLAASDALRLEANFLEAPAEIPYPATPFHAGLAQLVDLKDGKNTQRIFEGSAQLEKNLTEFPATRSIKAFKLLDKGLAKKGDTVQLHDGTVISACVATFYSAALGASLAFAYIPRKHLNDSLYIETDSSRSSTESIRPEEVLGKIKEFH
jgi:aminomethyltransferase